MSEVVQGLMAHAIWGGFTALLRRVAGRQIKIEDPRPQEVLQDPQPLGDSLSYRVRGTLKHIPRGHRIWLLVENERNGDVWPQGYQPVQHNPQTGQWEGRVRPGELGLIHAVVAPPTSDDFFSYYQRVGDHLTKWQPLARIPPECVNRDSVQAKTKP